MRDFIIQMQAALLHKLYYLAFASALMIPDMTGAMDADNGRASKRKYEQWFDAYIAPKYDGTFTGVDCYLFRCSMLHQGSAKHADSRYKRILFVEPNAPGGMRVQRSVLNGALAIDLELFCKDMADGVEQWLAQVEGTEKYERNHNLFICRYPRGLPPYIIGVPVIS